MEQEMHAMLNYSVEPFDPWSNDEELLHLIMTGQLVPPVID